MKDVKYGLLALSSGRQRKSQPRQEPGRYPVGPVGLGQSTYGDNPSLPFSTPSSCACRPCLTLGNCPRAQRRDLPKPQTTNTTKMPTRSTAGSASRHVSFTQGGPNQATRDRHEMSPEYQRHDKRRTSSPRTKKSAIPFSIQGGPGRRRASAWAPRESCEGTPEGRAHDRRHGGDGWSEVATTAHGRPPPPIKTGL